MTLWFVLAVMTAVAVFAVLWPLSRPSAATSTGNDVLVYRDQLEEIARDRAAGRIGEVEAEAARVEVSRRLLAAADRTDDQMVSSVWRRRMVAIAALILLPIGSAVIYLGLGSPLLPGQPLALRDAQGNPPVDRLVAQIEAHLESNPKDGRGWEVVAPVYMQLGRFDDAVKAWRNAAAYNGSTAQREANLGEALVAVANGVVTAEAKQAFDRALALDAADPKARYFLGLAAEQDGRHAEAAAIWRAMLASAPPDAPWAEFVRSALAHVKATPPASSPGPSADDVATASELNPQQRQDMIAGMVDRLATRLKNDGSDIDGWLRLVRAYTVLGERDKALAAAADARRSIGDDPAKLRQLDELVKGLGLQG
jgi:cytochrome c-type biogenesis protein CcmH